MTGKTSTTYCATLWFGLYIGLLVLNHSVFDGVHFPVLMFALTFLCLSISVIGFAWWVNRIDQRFLDWRWPITLLGGSLLLVFFGPNSTLAAPFHGFLLLMGCTAIGRMLGQHMSDAAHVWPLILVAMSFDLWSVFAAHGMTHQLVESAQSTDAHLLNPLMLTLPIPGFFFSPLLGIGDILFSGFLMGGVTRLGLSQTRTLAGLGLGLFFTLVILLVLAIPIPALPILGPTMGFALGSTIKPRRHELLGALLFITVGLSLLHFGLAP